jgi:putative ABC transport system ATP-binding protein
MALFEARSLCKHYHAGTPYEVRALDSVSFGIELGSWTVLSGPSGSGKTTLLAILAGLDRPSRGDVLHDGQSLTGCSDAELTRYRRHTGFVFQDYALIPGLSAEENVYYPLLARGWPRALGRRRARELLSQFGLAQRISAKGKELSGGEQQRVGIARALASDPNVIFADEPTSNLDVETRKLIVDTLRCLNALGKTLILSSHDPVIVTAAQQIIELDKGKIKS